MAASHPTDEELSAFGLGKAGDAPAIARHLEGCLACRNRVAEASPDTFLGRVRDARGGAGQSLTGAAPAAVGRKAPVPAAESLPPGLAANPDYEIKGELGRGGMGVVYLAHNTLMGRDEVLKVMSKDLMDRPGVLDRFLREIRAVAKLRHPNIVTAYYATRVGDSIVLAMEYVDGLDLSKLVKAKGPLPVAHACHFVHQAATGLQHAHEEGLIHRDIKPANLILSRKGDKKTVKVLDFGLAKVVREGNFDAALTSAGQMLGTPDFVAPEQILDAQTADVRADIYSLGGTLYYLLTGRAPFKAASLYDLYQAHISRETDPLNVVRPDVPADLAALVGKMMAKEPKRRFQTPNEVARALAPFLKTGKASTPRPAAPGSTAAAAAPAPATPASTAATRPAPASPPTAPAEPLWQTLVDVGPPAPLSSSPPNPPAAVGRRPPRRAGVAVAALSLALGPLLVGVMLVLKYRGAEIRVTNLPDGAVVQVDDAEVTPGTNGGDARVTLSSGTHRLAIALKGKPPYRQNVTVDWGGAEPAVVAYEPPAPAEKAPATAERPAAVPEPPAAPTTAGNTAAVPETPPRTASREPEPEGKGLETVSPAETQKSESAVENREEAGFVSLCTGSDLSAWNALEANVNGKRADPELVAVADQGEIHFRGNDKWVNPVTRRSYRDFVLRLDYRFPADVAPNDWSGVTLFSDAPTRPSEHQAIDVRVAPGQTGTFYASGQLKPPGVVDSNQWTGASRKNTKAELPAGQWNRLEVRCEGTTLTCALNGQVVNQVQSAAPLSVWIGLRNWSSRVRYRNIRIKARTTTF